MKKFVVVLCLCCFLVLLPSYGALAKVDTVKAPTAGNTIYIAGNPDLYPIEYYDTSKNQYAGIIPELFKLVSEKTGIDFSYIYAGEQNQQERLAKNKQCEIISAHIKGDLGKEYDEYIILSFDIDGAQRDVCICFTSIADEKMIEAVTESIREISDSQLLSFSISETLTQNRSTIGYKILIPVVIILLLVISALSAVLIKRSKEQNEKKKNSLVDELTGIGNKKYFEQTYNHWISENTYSLYYIAYISFDIKRMIKYQGPSIAEQIQRMAADILSTSVADTDFCARVDEGIFLMAFQAPSEDHAQTRISELLDKLCNLLISQASEFNYIFRSGVFHLDFPGIQFETAYINAEKGYNFAVENNKPYYFADRKLLSSEAKNTKLRQNLSGAIKNHEIYLYFQYIVDAKSSLISGAEILSRLYNNETGLVKPGNYIEYMINAGIIDKHDLFVLEGVCKQLEEWSKNGKKDLWLSCNFTRNTISREDFISRFEEVINRYSFSRENMVIEITEDSLADNQTIAYSNIVACKKSGVRIALDDFGSGYTSFSDLCDYPVDIIKIDRHIVSKASTPKGNALLKGIINIAHDLSIKVLCEGVEVDKDNDIVKNADCDLIQGYYYSRVLPLEESDSYYSKYTNGKLK